MSGGSWGYVYRHFEEAGNRLLLSADPLRVALGKKALQMADAMHAIEWVDSGDFGENDDVNKVREALCMGETGEDLVADAAIARIKAAIGDANRAIEAIREQ